MKKNITSRDECLIESKGFLDEIFLYVNELGLDVSGLDIDHVCLRIGSSSLVNKLCEQISQVSIGGSYISCKNINGRNIYIFKLKEPIKYGDYLIYYVELPYPGSGHDYPYDNREHAEFVISCEATTKDDFEQEFLQYFSLDSGVIEYSISMPTVENSSQLPNPTISIQKYRGLNIKFHPKNIGEIVLNNNK